jgi:hypothetical protein
MKSILSFCGLLALLFAANPLSAQTATALLVNGTAAAKFDIVFMGDGFTSAQQGEYNTLVSNYFNAIFTHDNGGMDDVLSELQDAINVYRVNMNSVNSGVAQFTCGADPACPAKTPTSPNTAYAFRYSGCWNCCWMSKAGDTDTRINNALATVGLSGADYVVMILNETGFGGCSYGRVLAITKSTSNNVLLHELGHSVGGLADEYDRPGCFAGPEPGARNASINANTPKWNLFARNTSTTTGNPVEYNVSQTNGEFEGAVYKDKCVHRPSSNSTMRGNTNLFNPPSYDEFWVRNKPRSNYNFQKVYAGDFKGTGAADVLLHFGNHLAAYEVGVPDGFTNAGLTTRVKSSYMTAKRISGPGGTWAVTASDQFITGDFSGDGKDDLLAFFPNGASSRLGLLTATATGFSCTKIFSGSLPGWSMQTNDRYFLADFNGDGRKDIYVFNTQNWNPFYMGMLRSTGTDLAFVRRYDQYLPGHLLSNTDKYFIADINGDNKEEFVLFNTASKATRLYRTDGTQVILSAQYLGSLPGWSSADQDQYHVADFNGDNKDDLYIFNGKNWGPEYLVMLRSNGTGYDYVIRYDNTLPGWDMNDYDSYYVGDYNGDGKEELLIYNTANWDSEYLGRTTSTGSALSAAWQKDWIGGWNLGGSDRLRVANARTGADALFISNTDWFGYFVPAGAGMNQQAMYKDYIRAFKHHDFGWY